MRNMECVVRGTYLRTKAVENRLWWKTTLDLPDPQRIMGRADVMKRSKSRGQSLPSLPKPGRVRLGSTLESHGGEKIYTRLDGYLRSKGRPLE